MSEVRPKTNMSDAPVHGYSVTALPKNPEMDVNPMSDCAVFQPGP